MSDQPTTTAATPEPERLACGCEWITKYCDEYHYEIRQRAHDAAVRRAVADRLRRQPWANALPIADAIEKDEWDV